LNDFIDFFNQMLAPGKGCPVSSKTLPVIVPDSCLTGAKMNFAGIAADIAGITITPLSKQAIEAHSTALRLSSNLFFILIVISFWYRSWGLWNAAKLPYENKLNVKLC
jgi:hypothetical protein